MITILVLSCCAILLALIIFQICLVLGAPLGKFAWGGSNKVLPTKFKIGSAISVLLYVFIALMLLSKVGIISTFENQFVDVVVWIIAGYFTLGVLMNAASRSKYERSVMTPVALIIAILCTIIAMS